MVLDRDSILASNDLAFEEVEVPEWGGSVRVRSLTGWERDQFEASITKRRGTDFEMNLVNARAKLVVLTVVDAEGNRVFSDDDVLDLGKKSAVALNRIFLVAQKLSGLSDQDVTELTRDFDPAQDAGRLSD